MRFPTMLKIHSAPAVLAPLVALLLGGAAAAAPSAATVPDQREGRAAGFLVRLSGEAVPVGGDPDGRGAAHLRFDPKRETVCLKMGWRRVAGTVTAMHLHVGKEGETGGHHIDLLDGVHLAGARNTFASCVQVQAHRGKHSARDLIQAVLDEPSGYYLNVHSSKFDEGAIRGQLD